MWVLPEEEAMSPLCPGSLPVGRVSYTLPATSGITAALYCLSAARDPAPGAGAE